MSSILLRLTSEYKALMKDMPEGIIDIDLIDSNINNWRYCYYYYHCIVTTNTNTNHNY